MSRVIFRFSLITVLVLVFAAGFLQAAEDKVMREIFPEGENFKAVKQGEGIIYYKAYNKEGRLRGAVFKVAARGYLGAIETMAGITAEGKITAIKVLGQHETPGLGSRVADPVFTGQFKDRQIRSLGEIQAVTGATISSRAVVEAVKKKAEEVMRLLGKDG